MTTWRQRAWAAAASLYGVSAVAAQIETIDGALSIQESLSVFAPGDQILAGPDGQALTQRGLLRLRTANEYLASTTVTLRRSGREQRLTIAADASWGINPTTSFAAESPRAPTARAATADNSAQLAEERGRAAQERWDGIAAERAWKTVLTERQRDDPAGPATVKAQLGLAEALLLRRNLVGAAQQFAAVEQQLAQRWPRAPLCHQALLGKAAVAQEQRNLEQSTRLLDQSISLDAELPIAIPVQIDRQRLQGRVAFLREDVIRAREHFESALKLARARIPDSVAQAQIEGNLAIVDVREGKLALAEQRLARTLAAAERDAPGSVLMGGTLMNLGNLHLLRRDWAAAERSYARAVQLFSDVSPISAETQRALTNLALAQGGGGNPSGAIETLNRVLAAQMRANPPTLDVAFTHNGLAQNHFRAGNLPLAESHYSLAIDMREKHQSLGIGLANVLTSRGRARRQQGNATGARTDLLRALTILEQLAPESHALAECLHELATIERDAGNIAVALERYGRAIDVLDAQQAQLGGSDETRASYSAHYSNYYKDYALLLLQQQRSDQAFETLERYRGRVLRSALNGADRVQDNALPRDLRLQRDSLRAERARIVGKLQSFDRPADRNTEVRQLLRELDVTRAREDVLATRIREHAPRLAQLTQNPAITLPQISRTLPRQTALVSYAVMPRHVEIFVLTSGAVRPTVTRSLVAASALREQVARLNVLLQSPTGAPDARRSLQQTAHNLYLLLFAPVSQQLAAYPELVIIPDGPLHRLPFAALIEKPARLPAGAPRYLIESRVLTTVVSAGVYAQQARSTRRRDLPELVAFGDPRLVSGADVATTDARDGLLRGDLLQPLPWARVEVEAIRRIMGKRARVFIGEDATEARVRGLATSAGALHFASHGVLDERTPLESFLLLAGPVVGGGPGNDGRLSAREVLELPPLPASLVTLSACSTSSMQDSDGEGLLGLTRAFQAAGANAVLSSLWKVSDRATSDLMREFYRQWPRASAAQALALAQRRYLTLHPFYWAAFTLSGGP